MNSYDLIQAQEEIARLSALCERYRKALEEIASTEWRCVCRDHARAALSAPCDSPGDNAAGS